MKILSVSLLFLVAVAATAYGQDCDHKSNSAERFSHVRLLPPVRIRNFDLANIEYTHEDVKGIHIGSLTADDDTEMPGNIWKEFKSRIYWILFCSRCKHIYTMVEVLPQQIIKVEVKK